MDIKTKLMESCAACPRMGEAVISAFECLLESDLTQAVGQTGNTDQDTMPLNPQAITENPDAAEVLANIATKAEAEKEQVEQAQAKLDQTTEMVKQTMGEMQQQYNSPDPNQQTQQQQV